MHRPAPRTWAVLAVFTLVASSIGFSLLGSAGPETGERQRIGPAGDQRSSGGAFPLGPIGFSPDEPPEITHAPPFPLEEGKIPTKHEALDFDKRYSRFIAKGTDGLDQLASDGHLKGAGTRADPYVLESFYVDGDLTIQSTNRAVVIRDGYVNGQLSLNYIGEQVYVHHVYAKDLRVNENVARNGQNTGGLFHDNHFGFVGQIRHFTGEFRDNEVGPVPEGIVRSYLSDTGSATLPEGVVFNFDGFHGADVHHNVFHGVVDIKLHGHNHGDCFTCLVHDHDDEEQLAYDEKVADAHQERIAPRGDAPEEGDAHDGTDGHTHDDGSDSGMTLSDALGFRTRHSIRYHSLMFRDNEIHAGPDAAYALRYNDNAHAGDDRTANSEPSPFLEDPHVHYQDITLRGNRLHGAPLRLDVFNAQDDHHITQNLGILRIDANTVQIPYTRGSDRDVATLYGFDLRRADGIELRLTDNEVRFIEEKDDLPAPALRRVATYPPELIGFRLQAFKVGNISIQGNTVNQGDLGVLVHTFAPQVHWTLSGNDFRTTDAWRTAGKAHGPDGGGD